MVGTTGGHHDFLFRPSSVHPGEYGLWSNDGHDGSSRSSRARLRLSHTKGGRVSSDGHHDDHRALCRKARPSSLPPPPPDPTPANDRARQTRENDHMSAAPILSLRRRFRSLVLVLTTSSVCRLHQRQGLLERHAGQDAQLLASWDCRFPEPEQHCAASTEEQGMGGRTGRR